jgi:hypothetical protein
MRDFLFTDPAQMKCNSMPHPFRVLGGMGGEHDANIMSPINSFAVKQPAQTRKHT